MNFFENEYTLPVILGNSREAISVATLLHRDTDLTVHILASKLSFIDRLIFKFHKVYTDNEDILLLALNDLADGFHEYHTPVLIYCDDYGKAFVERHFEHLEQRYVLISSQSTKNFFLKDVEN